MLKKETKTINPRINRLQRARDKATPTMLKNHEARLKTFQYPIMIRTSSVQLCIVEAEQCQSCGILDDPILMEEINEKPYCSECADELNELETAPSGKLIPPKRYGAGSLGL